MWRHIGRKWPCDRRNASTSQGMPEATENLKRCREQFLTSWFQTSGLPKCEAIIFCSSRPSNLWCFVTVALRNCSGPYLNWTLQRGDHMTTGDRFCFQKAKESRFHFNKERVLSIQKHPLLIFMYCSSIRCFSQYTPYPFLPISTLQILISRR